MDIYTNAHRLLCDTPGSHECPIRGHLSRPPRALLRSRDHGQAPGGFADVQPFSSSQLYSCSNGSVSDSPSYCWYNISPQTDGFWQASRQKIFCLISSCIHIWLGPP